MSYPDFVGFVNQWNVLPGAYVTINKWAIFGAMTRDSSVLQVACTTGFQSRELSGLTGCRVRAFDISSVAIEMARYNLARYATNANVEYECADCYTFTTEERFTHLMVGAGLRFLPDPIKALGRCITFLAPKAYILASPFWVTAPVPVKIISKAQSIFGITPTIEGYKTVMRLFKDFEIFYEDKNIPVQESETELEEYCSATIERACRIRQIADLSVRKVMYRRLLAIRRMSNELRPYQAYSTLVLRYRQETYPARYVELF
jgi:ubiquinone/menaquinone biosynthesis C-methylase UbiE